MDAETKHFNKTVEIVQSFVGWEKELTERINKNKEEKELLLADIKDYVTLTNPLLFGWVKEAGDKLKENNLGEVSLDFGRDQSQLFPATTPDFSRYPVKNFSELTGILSISMHSIKTLTLRADISFGGWFGRFLWDDGSDDYFFSEPHLVADQERFGPLDMFDLLSMVGSRQIRDRNGKDREMRHPVEIINERLCAKASATLERQIYGKQ